MKEYIFPLLGILGFFATVVIGVVLLVCSFIYIVIPLVGALVAVLDYLV